MGSVMEGSDASRMAARAEIVEVEHSRQLPAVLDEPEAFEVWLTALSPLERSAFEERARFMSAIQLATHKQ